jgi:hypothetical protein
MQWAIRLVRQFVGCGSEERRAKEHRAGERSAVCLVHLAGATKQGDIDMLSRMLAVSVLATALAATAYAADTSSSSSTNTSTKTNGQQMTENLPQEIRAKLKDDGFSDVKVVPDSFIVSAKDKRGEPVTMMISPNSMMMVTQVTNGTASSKNNQK